MAIRGPLRKVTLRVHHTGHFGCPKGCGSVTLYLECGHSERRKWSKEPQHQVRCWECGLAGNLGPWEAQ